MGRAMITWREGRVTGTGRQWQAGSGAALELQVDVAGARACRALAYVALVGRPEPGDRVLLNTTALDRRLGTGGYALVVALPDRLPPTGPPGPGHLVKARYTPQQAMVLGVDEQESPHHDLLADADDLLAMPVVVADLHSSLPAVLAGVFAARPATRVAYVMTDGGALPAWFSRSVAGLREAGRLAACVTSGQAFGGDLEAVTVHTALLAARHVVGAEVAVVIQGPGNLGTGTRWGFSGVAAGEAINAAATLHGRPVAALRISDADPRERHRGISHHSLTAYGRVALAPADVAVPDLSAWPDLARRVEDQLPVLRRHRTVRVASSGLSGGLMDALRASPVPLSTMGRGLDDDPAAFLAAAAAGAHAASLLTR